MHVVVLLTMVLPHRVPMLLSQLQDRLLEDYGDVEIVLSSANTISREKIPMLFR